MDSATAPPVPETPLVTPDRPTRRGGFQVELWMLPDMALLLLGWGCTVVELVLLVLEPEEAWKSPWMWAIFIMVGVMALIWSLTTLKRGIFDGELASADLGSFCLLLAASSAIFWVPNIGRPQTVPPGLILVLSLLLQVVATFILVRPLLKQK